MTPLEYIKFKYGTEKVAKPLASPAERERAKQILSDLHEKYTTTLPRTEPESLGEVDGDVPH